MSNRWCYFVDETMATEGGFIPAVVTENEPGYSPLSGHPEKMTAPWVWGPGIAHARRICDEANAQIGVTPEQAREIVLSSMVASRQQQPVDHIHFRQDADGQPYLAYFDADRTLGFCWSGDPAQSIEVCREMGEPVIATIKVDMERLAQATNGSHPGGMVGAVMNAFRYLCDSWVENEYEEAPR